MFSFLLIWEAIIRDTPSLAFFFGQPSRILQYFADKSLDGTLLVDTITTVVEVLVGFAAGNILGVSLGMALWSSPFAFLVSRPFIVILGSAPIFALAPILIIWFGTGLMAKIVIVIFSTMFVAMLQACTGATSVPDNYLRLMETFGASKSQVFRKVILPSALVWVFSAFRANVGLSILGAFVGEFISSTRGLGHMILVAGGLFDISLVLCGVSTLIMVALAMTWAVEHVEWRLRQLIVNYL